MDSKNKTILLPLALATVITLYLFYLDEGYFDFRWMKNPGNWVAFAFYVAALFTIFFLLGMLLRWAFKQVQKIRA